MNYRAIISFCLLFAVFVVSSVKGQNENVTIVDKYKANVQDADKINEKPATWDTIVNRETMSYDFLSKPMFKTYLMKPFNPLDPIPQSVGVNKNNYLRLGIGNYLNVDGEAYIYQPVSKSTGIGLDFEHFSSAGGIKDYAPNAFNRNYVDLYVKSVLRYASMKFDVNYNRDMVHFYGFKPKEYSESESWVLDNRLLRDSIKQVYNQFGGRFLIEANKFNDFDYTVDLGYNYMFDRFGTAEGNVDVLADLNSDVKWFAGDQNIGATVDFELFHNSVLPTYNSGNLTFDSQSVVPISTLTTIFPYFQIDYKMLRFNIGFDVALSTDTIAKFYAHPQIELGFLPIDKVLYVYLGARGGVNRTGLQALVQQNKFLNTQTLDYRFSNTLIDGYFGVKANFAKYFEVNAEVGYMVQKNTALFVNDPTALFHNKFTTLYDNQNALYGKAYLKFNMNETYKAEAGFYYSYPTFEKQLQSWQSPNLNVYGKADVKIYRGLRANALIYVCGSTYAKGYTDYAGNIYEDHYLPAYFDVNLGATYKLNDWLSFFVDFNNILGKKYEYWNNYLSQSFNFMVGAGFSF